MLVAAIALMARILDAGLVYCVDYLDSNLDWLQKKLELIQKSRGLQCCRHRCQFVTNKSNVQPQTTPHMCCLIFLDKWSCSPCMKV